MAEYMLAETANFGLRRQVNCCKPAREANVRGEETLRLEC
jgi:hypothetical protein